MPPDSKMEKDPPTPDDIVDIAYDTWHRLVEFISAGQDLPSGYIDKDRRIDEVYLLGPKIRAPLAKKLSKEFAVVLSEDDLNACLTFVDLSKTITGLRIISGA
jgi:hypothetical protein